MSSAGWDDLSDIVIDGVPLGADYGVCMESDPQRDSLSLAPVQVVQSPLLIAWLTKSDTFSFKKVRRLPFDARVSGRIGGTKVFDFHLGHLVVREIRSAGAV